MKSVWNARDHGDLRDRVQRLTPASSAQWGRMNAPQMVAHLTDSLRMASGELHAEPKNMPLLRYPPMKQLIIYCLPFPKGAPTAPELLARKPGAWTEEVGLLRDELDQFVRRGPAATVKVHPAFGRLSGKAWGTLVYRHIDHHLKQFGV